MKKLICAALIVIEMAAGSAMAREVAGVSMPENVTVAGKTLRLNGAGLRRKTILLVKVQVYVAGLYLEHPTSVTAAMLSSEQVKRLDLRMLRSLNSNQVTGMISEGFAKDSGSRMPTLQTRVDRLNAMFPDVAKGDLISLTYVPQKGTTLADNGVERGVIEGKDFADALFSIWLGRDPVQADLKDELLGAH